MNTLTFPLDFSKVADKSHKVTLHNPVAVVCTLTPVYQVFEMEEDDKFGQADTRDEYMILRTENHLGEQSALALMPDKVAGRRVSGEIPWVESGLIPEIVTKTGATGWEVMDDNWGSYLILSYVTFLDIED